MQFFLPTIFLPTEISKKSDTTIDNIFTNYYNPNTISGNLTISISDHLPSFTIFPISKSKHSHKKQNVFRRDLSKLKEEDYSNIKNDLNAVKWDELLLYDKNDVNFSFNTFFKTVEEIIDEYCPQEEMSKRELKNKQKK